MLNFYQDPGHGWLEVPVAELKRLGIVGQISRYSYVSRDGKLAYLEEDCDAGVYIRASALKREDVKDIHQNDDSFIRSLPRLCDRRIA